MLRAGHRPHGVQGKCGAGARPRGGLSHRRRRERAAFQLLPAVHSLQGARRLLPARARRNGTRRRGDPRRADAALSRRRCARAIDEHRRFDPARGAHAGGCHGVHDFGAGRHPRVGCGGPRTAGARRPAHDDRHRGVRQSRHSLRGCRRMMRARVAYAGAIHDAAPERDNLRLADGRLVPAADVVWLPPFEVGTVIALGLNYADHAKELAFKAQEEPLVFLKGPGTLLGHRGTTRRPAAVNFMHYECELAVVIGRPAKKIPRSQAFEHVAGYCIANDYAIRDYLENWYRPNLRVKNRDGATALGPWLVDAADVPAPPQLALATFVNGRRTQSGNTRDLVFAIDVLIEYLSAFMTLDTGDVILTGTPEGVVNVDVGDEVVCEIDGLGQLRNWITSDAAFGR